MVPFLFCIGLCEIPALSVFLGLELLLGILVGWKEARWVGYSNRAILLYAANAISLIFCFQRMEDTAFLCQTLDNFPVKIYLLSCAPTATATPVCSSITSITTCQNTPWLLLGYKPEQLR